jgi:hypothetical protein
MLCQPSTAILLLSIAGVIYHLLTGRYQATLWWLLIGIVGTGTFQALCFGNLEPVAWVLMMIPVLIVCFFLAVALFASRMRIDNIMSVPCDRCGFPHRHEDPCDHEEKKKPKCHNVMCNTGGDTGGDCDNDCKPNPDHHEKRWWHHSEHHHRSGSD